MANRTSGYIARLTLFFGLFMELNGKFHEKYFYNFLPREWDGFVRPSVHSVKNQQVYRNHEVFNAILRNI